ncbi:MAG: preprotein translocase subunit SecE [Gammaproteobacteria bacterium]|nr:preprotein translocase subunit SecE [Gammaproteobacteria bacterium]
MNREMRRLQEREDRRLKQKRKKQQQQRKRRPQRGNEQLSMAQRLQRFIREVRAELKRVSWPSREQLIAFTAVTVITSTALTIYIFALDIFFKDGVLFFLGTS